MRFEWVADHMLSVFWITDDPRSDLLWEGDGWRKERWGGWLWQWCCSSNTRASKTNSARLTREREKERDLNKRCIPKLWLKRKSIFTWGNNWCFFWISKISLTAHDRRREYQRDQSRSPAAPFSSGTISVWHCHRLRAAALDLKSVETQMCTKSCRYHLSVLPITLLKWV